MLQRALDRCDRCQKNRHDDAHYAPCERRTCGPISVPIVIIAAASATNKPVISFAVAPRAIRIRILRLRRVSVRKNSVNAYGDEQPGAANPIGRYLRHDGRELPVVGVVSDIRDLGPRETSVDTVMRTQGNSSPRA